MADSSSASDDAPHSQLPASARKKTSDLDERQTPNKPVPAWQLREQMKSQGRISQSRPSVPNATRPLQRSSRDLDDPLLPPAFRASFAAQRKKRADDFNTLDSVHTAKSQMSINDSDSSDSFDGHDSFASLADDDDEDDEAYREGRNLIARQQVECSRSSPKKKKNVLKGDFRLKKSGTHGTLDFIAE